MAVENEYLRVFYAPEQSQFSVVARPTGKPFLVQGQTGPGAGQAAEKPVRHPNFGEGRELTVPIHDGHQLSIALFPKVPFALFRLALANRGTEIAVTNRVRTLLARLDLSRPPGSLRTLGTGGLLAPEKNPGSYAYLAVADPATRSGVVGGWLTHDRGSGVVFSPVADDAVHLEARIDYGRLRLKPGQATETETFMVGWFEDARLGLEAYAEAVARVYSVKLPPQPAGYCTWYAEKHGGACDEKNLALLAEYTAKHLRPFGFDFLLIDDHWQAGISTNGPKRNFTAHRPTGPYPAGMKAAAENVKQHGLVPGLWFMPFAGTWYDPFFAEHQDWFARTQDGRPFETRWGGTCLDMTHPGARGHVSNVVYRIAHEWGYPIFKLDGLWTGSATRLMYVNNGYKDDQIGESWLHDPDKTHVEAFRDGLRLVRQVAGPKVFLLGCCVSQNMRSFGGAFGLVDAMRVGPDTGAGHIGAPHGSRNYFLHGRVWQNDPDCVSVRAATPLGQARINASWTAISGQLFYNSDWIPDLPPERLDILKRTLPAHGLPARPVDLFEYDPARVWLVSDTRQAPRRDVVALFNWDAKKAAVIECEPSRLGLPPAPEYVGFDFWANRFIAPFSGKITSDLPPATCRILSLRAAAPHPQLVGTSRHVTQGIVDLSEERWNPDTRTLSGTSRVVGGDSYELRLVVPAGPKSWKARTLSVAADDEAAGVKTALDQQGPKIRATLASPGSRAVRWQIQFEPARVDNPPPAPIADLQAKADYGSVTLTWKESPADGFRIMRGDGAKFESSSASLVDSSVAPGQKYEYSVVALGWNNTASEPVRIEVTLPAKLRRPPIPPAPDVHLADLKPVSARTGWGKMQVNQSIESKPLTVEGKQYKKGLGVHADSLVVYVVPGGARRFVAVVGLDDEKRDDPRSSVVFEVYGDVKEMGEEPVLLGKSPVLSSKTLRSWAFDLELNSRFKQLRLVVTDAGDGIASDHADWVEAGFLPK